MTRIDGGDFGWAAEQARRALEGAQAPGQPQAELQRARALAASASSGLDPQNPEGPMVLGHVLAQVQGLVPEARLAFASELARARATVAGGPPPPDAAGIVETLLNQSCPPGSDRRAQVGQALLAAAGANVGGLQGRVLETAVQRALAGLRPSAAPKASPSAPQQDVLERALRPIGAGRERGADGPWAAPAVSAPMVQSSSADEAALHGACDSSLGSGGESSLGSAGATERDLRAEVRTLVRAHAASTDHASDVASDALALTAALGAAPSASALPSAAESILLGVERVAWSETAPALVTAPLHAVASRLETITTKAANVWATLNHAEGGTLKQQWSLVGAAGLMEKAAFHASAARALVEPLREPRESLRAIAAARSEVQHARAYSGEALTALGELTGRYRGLRATVGEVREAQRLARQSETDLTAIGARAAMLEAVDAGAGALSVEPSEESATGPGILTEEDLGRIGSALDPGKPPPQITWSEELVNTTCELGRQQGGVTDADGARHLELARMALGGDGVAPSGEPRPLEAPDLAAVLKMAGVPLEKVDPSQLLSAASYVSSATSLADQQEKLRKALDSFQTLATIGAPRLSRQQMVDQLWSMARVPGHALQKLSDTEVQRKHQEVAGALNAGPGAAEIKIGSHNLKLQVGEAGQVLNTSCKKPSFLSRAWGVVKKVAPIALTAASFVFTGGTATALIRLGQGLLSAVDAIKSGSLLAIATAGASIVGAGSSLFKGGAGIAGRIATVADNTARGLQGVSRMRQGDLLGGLASIGQGIAGGIGSLAGAANKGLLSVAERLAYVSTKLSAVGTGVSAFRGFTSANRALDEARRMLASARASGDRRAVAEAEKQLKEAESQKRTSILGAAAGALDSASLWVGDRARWPGAPVLEFGGAGLGSRLQLAGQGLRVARDVSAGDYLGVAVGGLGMGANVDAARHGGASSALTDVARMAEAGLDYHRSRQALSEAEEAVANAEAHLAAARAMGDPELVRQAELALSQARRGHESAAMGGIAAGESLIGTAQSVAADRRIRPTETAVREAMELAQTTADGLDELQCRVDVPPAIREALAAEARQLDEAARRFEDEMTAAGGNLDGQTAAARRYEATVAAINEKREQVVVALSSGGFDTAKPGPQPASPAYASLRVPSSSESSARPAPERVGTLAIRPGMTLWEISMRTGVPVEAIREFNAAVGNELPGDRELQIGSPIHVPLGMGWQTSRPKEAFEVAQMVDQANRQAQGLPPRVLPQVVFREVPELPPPSELPTSEAPGDPSVAGVTAPQSNPFSVVKDTAQRVQDAIHDFTGDLVDAITNTGVPGSVAAAATLPVHLFDSVVDFNAGLFKGGVDLVDGYRDVVTHPIDTGLGLLELGRRFAETSLEGQAVAFFADVASGRFGSLDEAATAWAERTDPLQLAQARLDLATDVGRATFAESIRLAQEGKYAEAVGVLFGQQGDAVFGAGILKGRPLGRAGRIAETASRLDDVPLAFRAGADELDATLVHDDYVRWVLGPEARQATFDTPWTGRHGLGTRRVDDFDELTGTAFEGNTTPWETMTPEKLAHKLDQATADYILRQTDPRVRQVVWFGTQPLPMMGLGARLAAYLRELGIPYWVVRP